MDWPNEVTQKALVGFDRARREFVFRPPEGFPLRIEFRMGLEQMEEAIVQAKLRLAEATPGNETVQ
jgi:hypothetical protein